MARKTYSASFKAKVALEAIKDDATIAELSQKYGVHPTQIKDWKNALITHSVDAFGGKNSTKEDQSKYVEALERKAGQLAVEVDFLKKNLAAYHGKKD